MHQLELVSISRFNRSHPECARWRIQDPQCSRRKSAGLDFLSLHGAGDMIRLPDGKRHDRERRIAGRAAGELAAIGDEQIFDIVGLAEFVHDTVPCFRAHPGYIDDERSFSRDELRRVRSRKSGTTAAAFDR